MKFSENYLYSKNAYFAKISNQIIYIYIKNKVG